MRSTKALLTSAGMVLTTVGMAVAQDPVLKVEIETAPTRTVWYTNPMWLAIGGIVALMVIVLAIMAARKGGDTTVIRDRL